MVICQYFLNNSCRFGSKCHNEHVDLRATIKQEMEAAIKGKQWPLSCFGPFKEKANLMSGEYDMSFEEVRLQYLESQSTNTFHIYEQQLRQKIQEANIRMQSLLDIKQDVLAMTIQIYNENRTEPTNSNQMFGGSDAFGSQQPSAQSIFGGNQMGNQFAASTSIFGGGASQGFGSSNQTSNNQTFGGPSSSSIFGGGMSQNAPASTTQASSIFGQSTFTASTAAQPSQNIFGQATSTFGQSSGGFMQTNTGNSFSSGFSNTGATSTVTSGFGSAANNSAPSTGLFGNANNAFMMQQQKPAETSMFGQPVSGGFGTAPAQPISSTGFGGMQPQQQPQQMQSSANIFGNLGQQAVQASLSAFSSNQMQPPPPPLMASITPQQAQLPPSTNTFSVQAQVASAPSNSSLYSKIEELSQEDLAAFQAAEFVLGNIPSVPPPRELC